jgi:hypothetical protein
VTKPHRLPPEYQLDLAARADRLATAMSHRGHRILDVAAATGLHRHTVSKVLHARSTTDLAHHALLLWCERAEAEFIERTAPEPVEHLRPLFDRPERLGGRSEQP